MTFKKSCLAAVAASLLVASAAKAETEARFLRERLAELRREDDSPSAPAAAPAAAVSPEPAPPAPPEKVWQFLVRRIRHRNQG